MENIPNIRKGGDLNTVSGLQLARTAELSVFLLYNEGLEVSPIIKGGKRNE